jgi:hypothetical protein
MPLSITLNIMTLKTMRLSIITHSNMSLGIMPLSITTLNAMTLKTMRLSLIA